jgi:hypothetical protein
MYGRWMAGEGRTGWRLHNSAGERRPRELDRTAGSATLHPHSLAEKGAIDQRNRAAHRVIANETGGPGPPAGGHLLRAAVGLGGPSGQGGLLVQPDGLDTSGTAAVGPPELGQEPVRIALDGLDRACPPAC